MTKLRDLFFVCTAMVSTLIVSTQVCAYLPEEGKVTATFGTFVNRTVYPGSESFARTPFMGGFGLTALGDVSDKGSLEISMIYMRKMYVAEERSLVLAEETDLMHITMGYRWWLNPYFSTSLNFFSAYSMGDTTVVQNDFIGLPDGPTTSAEDKTEYGLDLSLTGELWSNRKYAVVSDLRYSWDATKKKAEFGDHVALMIGLRYLVQSEKRVEKRN